MDRSNQRDAKFYKRASDEVNEELDKKSMWSMDKSNQRNAHFYKRNWDQYDGDLNKRSMWSMDRSNQRNAHFYKRNTDQEDKALYEYLLLLYDNVEEAPSYETFLELLNQLKEDLEGDEIPTYPASKGGE